MTYALTFVLLVLTVSRLLRLVQVDHITERFRETALYNRWPYDAPRGGLIAEWLPERREVQFTVRRTLGRPDVPPKGLSFGLHCPWCLGIWLAGALVAGVAQLVSLPLPLLWWAGVAEGAGWLAKWR